MSTENIARGSTWVSDEILLLISIWADKKCSKNLKLKRGIVKHTFDKPYPKCKIIANTELSRISLRLLLDKDLL